MKKAETLLGAFIGFVVVDIIAWELLGAISWPNGYSFMRPVILGVFAIGELIVLWKIIIRETGK